MPVMTSSKKHAWWLDLRHSGLVVAPALLEEYFPDGLVEPKWYSYQRLRERYATFETWCQRERAYEPGTDAQPLYTWLDGVLDQFLGHETSRWQKGSHIAAAWKHETIMRERLAPDRVLFRTKNQSEPALFVWIEKTRQLGQGQGRTAYGKLLELLRAKNVKLGLLTNGRQFRLCYAGLDYDSWVEWDVESWFAEGELRRQLHGFYTLLGPTGLDPRNTKTTSFPLLEAAEASRSRQGELSAVLGEQVRESIELLLHELNRAVREQPELLDTVRRSPQGSELPQRRVMEALYQAAVRIIMRLVIIFFAEARDMLPRSLAIYHTSYGLEGLYEQLRRAAQYEGRNALEDRESAWARLLGLFSLIYSGSSLHALPVHEYGGLLFRPGQPDSPDATLRAIALFESLDNVTISDAMVLRLLELLKNGKLKIRQGRSSRWVKGPVDFSELRTEYIGLMYQGLLDFNLHATDQPMIFLNVGQEPVLPLKLLEDMSDQRLKDLLKKLSTEIATSAISSEGGEGEEEEAAVSDDAAEEAQPDAIEEDEITEDEPELDEQDEITLTDEEQLKRRASIWATRAVELAGLVKKPKGKHKDSLYLYEQARDKQARALIKRTLEQNEFYLIRRGGTRKGSGTFYTRPQLAVPITWRTLEPLAYTTAEDGTRIPRKPEEILALKVCDPACGSASFLVAALHYLTDALYESLVYHHRISEQPKDGVTRIVVTLPLGTPSKALPEEEILPVRPDSEHFERMTKARLRRYVVERCIYGVDLSPLAVELARMSLWIETMDRDLPFTFLDHKIKVGNSLVGAWFDTFREYPIMAWMREGGDTSHSNGVHYQAKEWTKALAKKRNDDIKPQLIRQIESSGQQLFLLREEQQITPEGLHSEITTEIEELHSLPVESAQEREERYRALQQTPEYQELKRAFNSWCAAWFWPADELDMVPTPSTFYNLVPSTRQIVDELAAELHFFHWELEFPDVFARSEHGFDAVLANPPWNILKPYSQEFFSNYDPIYRAYGRQEALDEQLRLFNLDRSLEREWLIYQAHFKSMNNWIKNASSPFGDPIMKHNSHATFTFSAGTQNEKLHALWRNRRLSYDAYTDHKHPFFYQGSAGAGLNTYKMFLEVAHHLLRHSGRLGMLLPSSIYTDLGAIDLRSLLLNQNKWEWLFGFINWKRVFDIDTRFKFAVVSAEKGQITQNIRVSFNRVDLADLEKMDGLTIEFPRERIERFSPASLAIMELHTKKDLDVLEKLYTSTVLFKDQSKEGWEIQSNREFNMTDDVALFSPLPKWQSKGYKPDSYGRWLSHDMGIALPLYEGRMIGPFDASKKGWVSGKGRSAVWREISFEQKIYEPQYLLAFDIYCQRESVLRGNKIGMMRIGSATNARSMYAALIDDMPCGNAISVLQSQKNNVSNLLSIATILNSFSYDYALRSRLGGINLNYFILAETPLISPVRIRPTICAQLAARLNLIMPSFAPQWLEMRNAYPHLGQQHWRKLWAITEHERLRLRCILDAIIAELYGLAYDDFAWILRDDPTNPKGFWRVDKGKPKELRHTTLALEAFKRLKELGLEAFSQEDWQFPPEIAAQFGPRFTAWQEQGTVAESWAECEEHARRMKELLPPETEQTVSKSEQGSNGQKNGKSNGAAPAQQSLWQPDHEQLSLWSED